MLPVKGIIFLLLLFLPFQIYAHRVNLFVDQIGNNLEITAFFPDGSPCKECRVEVLDKKGRVLQITKTDEVGKAILSMGNVTDIKVVLKAGEGHQAEKFIKFDTPKKEPNKKQSSNLSMNKQSQVVKTPKEEDSNSISSDQLSEIQAELKGLRQEIVELRKNSQRIWLRDIFSVLGYLLGVWALLTLWKRKNAS
jgi:nickel transport protein